RGKRGLQQRAADAKGRETGKFPSVVVGESVFVGQIHLLSSGQSPQTSMAAGRNLPSKQI
ncbi:hypothetical protein, partial [Mesorhizobium sp. M2A.F.Ca.ET.067.02.1.1]|uniref:hypothetical protein n=1 Tax=Mesorhizobium sp. M2A.F.Ca.ET.067.02.1.1 TaxID=2496749 RepID=UPI00167B1C0B